MRIPRFSYVPVLYVLSTSLVCVSATPLPAQPAFATHVVIYDTHNGAGGGTFQPGNALGMPIGGGLTGGSADVHSLGIAGYLTLGFGVTLTDGPGADFLVAENPFSLGVGRVYGELMFVEVSTNGVDFARFPSRFFGGDGGAFAINTVGFVSGLAGQTPVFANPANPNVDPQDVVEAGGDAFDLADLATHPLVVSRLVDLHNITQVRLVDVVSGTSLDSRGRTILDPSSGSADVDAVTVIQHRGNQSAHAPLVDLYIPQDGNFTLSIADPDGIDDLDPTSLRMSLFGQPVDPVPILSLMTLHQVSATSFTLVLGGPLPQDWLLQIGVSIKDRAGNRSGALRQRPLN